MLRNKKIQVLLGISGILMVGAVIGFGNHFVSGEENEDAIGQNEIENPINIMTHPQLVPVVADVIKTMPNLSSEIEEIQNMTDNEVKYYSNDVSVKKLLNTEKIYFRLEAENRLTNQESTLDINAIAERYTNNYLEALSIAKDIYGVTVSQEEVTEYIDKNIAPVTIKEKETYAKSLGLTTYQLDYVFDRDLYAMDTLWKKLIPVLMEKHSQNDGEDHNAYQDRIKKVFYSHQKK